MARYVNGQLINEYPIQTAPNWAYYSANNNRTPNFGSAATNTFSRGAPFLANFFNRFGKGKAILNGKFNIPNIGQMAQNIRDTQIWQGGPTVAQGANTVSGIYQGVKALKGINDNIQADSDTRSLKNDISLAMASNPMYDMYLDASDEKLLRQMQNGSLAANNVGNVFSGAAQGIPQATLAAMLGGITGGGWGAAIGGIGSLINSGISGYGQGTEETNAKLSGLYNKLKQAEEEYRSMRRPRGLSSAGLQSRYFNELY